MECGFPLCSILRATRFIRVIKSEGIDMRERLRVLLTWFSKNESNNGLLEFFVRVVLALSTFILVGTGISTTTFTGVSCFKFASDPTS